MALALSRSPPDTGPASKGGHGGAAAGEAGGAAVSRAWDLAACGAGQGGAAGRGEAAGDGRHELAEAKRREAERRLTASTHCGRRHEGNDRGYSVWILSSSFPISL
jgi:hypothetical protein